MFREHVCGCTWYAVEAKIKEKIPQGACTNLPHEFQMVAANSVGCDVRKMNQEVTKTLNFFVWKCYKRVFTL